MNRNFLNKAVVPVTVAAATVMSARAASAADCTTLPNLIFVVGSSAVKPFMAALGKALSAATPPTTLVYASPGSCVGVQSAFNPAMNQLTGGTNYWDATGMSTACTLMNPQNVDVGVSDVYSQTCGAGAPPAGIGEFQGPNQVMNFVVPMQSTESMISNEAAYFVYGFGANSGVTPWTNISVLFQRGAASGTQSMISTAIGVAPGKWQGTTVTGGSAGMITSLSSPTTLTNANAALGILASTDADGQTMMNGMNVSVRSILKILAYQHKGQDCAWLPDSSSTSFDKKNVRDGQYPIWGPIHFYTAVDTTTMLPTKQAIANFVGYFSGKVMPPTGVNLLQLEIQTHTVPACAMHVKRSAEIGDMIPFKAASSCDCYFDFTANGATTCTKCAMVNDPACTGSTQCTMYDATTGYCEAK
jgi:ABC-type phosphate transport system substrate-binding protein